MSTVVGQPDLDDLDDVREREHLLDRCYWWASTVAWSNPSRRGRERYYALCHRLGLDPVGLVRSIVDNHVKAVTAIIEDETTDDLPSWVMGDRR